MEPNGNFVQKSKNCTLHGILIWPCLQVRRSLIRSSAEPDETIGEASSGMCASSAEYVPPAANCWELHLRRRTRALNHCMKVRVGGRIMKHVNASADCLLQHVPGLCCSSPIDVGLAERADNESHAVVRAGQGSTRLSLDFFPD